MASIWPPAVLFLWLFSSVYAAQNRPALTSISQDPAMHILQLDSSSETPNADGAYSVPDEYGGQAWVMCKKGLTFAPPINVDGGYYVGCCPQGSTAHMSGDTKKGFMCCDPGTERTGDATTGYACCPAGKHVSGTVADGNYMCCDTGLEMTGDKKTTGLACCPKGQHVSGTVADGNYMCCDIGTERTGSTATGYQCCAAGQQVVGNDVTGYACCAQGQSISGNVKTGYLCCGAGHERVGSNGKYACCPTGQDYDGTNCVPIKPLCPNGKQMVNGQCVCPAGTTEKNGNCVATPPPPPPATGATKPCDSGIVSGKLPRRLFTYDVTMLTREK